MKNLFKIGIIIVSLLITSLSIAKTTQDVLLVVMIGCDYCSQAESILNKDGIKFRTTQGTGAVPRLYVDGKYIGTGVDVVQSWAESQKSK